MQLLHVYMCAHNTCTSAHTQTHMKGKESKAQGDVPPANKRSQPPHQVSYV